ncbi:MAG: TetR/AcrR family transcriptional regulator [Chitinophagaceae bacterium]|nr:TetR/AcrR family transcriptional regulator [Rubrivivax sp.]
MRVTQKEMESGHRRIVEGASRLLREQGVRDTSVASAMQEAGMTHGGFYRHFQTKDDLVIEALRQAFDEFVLPLELRQELAAPQAVAAEYKALYLSEQHLDNPGQGCPMPALGSDIARAADPIKSEFAAGAQRLIAAMARTKQGSPEQRTTAATREIAMLVGAMLIARASNSQTARAVLDACKG